MNWDKLRELDAALPVPLWMWFLAYAIIFTQVFFVAVVMVAASLLFLFF